MNNSFIISFGDFKIDLPIKTLTSLAKQAAREQAKQKKPAAAPAIVKEIETPEVIKQAAPVVQATTSTANGRGRAIPYGRYNSFSAYLKEEILPNMVVGTSQFVPHPDTRRARQKALDSSYELRAKGTHIIISVRQAIESGVSGVRIFRLR
jgi:hypothetical protein